jgi:hypothetical protein
VLSPAYNVYLFVALQILQMVDGFIQDDPNWLLFTRDLSYSNFVVTDANQVLLKDLSHIMLLDKDMFSTETPEEKEDKCDDECFDKFYDDLVGTKHEHNKNEECSKILDYSGHMFSLACRLVISDLDADVEHRRSNPLAKSFPGTTLSVVVHSEI